MLICSSFLKLSTSYEWKVVLNKAFHHYKGFCCFSSVFSCPWTLNWYDILTSCTCGDTVLWCCLAWASLIFCKNTDNLPSAAVSSSVFINCRARSCHDIARSVKHCSASASGSLIKRRRKKNTIPVLFFPFFIHHSAKNLVKEKYVNYLGVQLCFWMMRFSVIKWHWSIVQVFLMQWYDVHSQEE